MAGIFELYKIVTWSSTTPNLKMGDSGNIWTVQDCHVVFYQTKPEDGVWQHFWAVQMIVTWSSTKPNLKMEDGGNIWTVQDCHMSPVGTHSKVTKSLNTDFPMTFNINYLIIYTQSHERVSYLVDVLKLRMEFDRKGTASAHKWPLLKWKTVILLSGRNQQHYLAIDTVTTLKNVKPLVHTALHFCTVGNYLSVEYPSLVTWLPTWGISSPVVSECPSEEYPAPGYLSLHLRNIHPWVTFVFTWGIKPRITWESTWGKSSPGTLESTWETHIAGYLSVHVRNIQRWIPGCIRKEYPALGYLGVHVRNIQPLVIWVSTWVGNTQCWVPECPREEYSALCYLSVHVGNSQRWIPECPREYPALDVGNTQRWIPGCPREENPALGYLCVHVRNIQPCVTWVSTWRISSPVLPECPREEYPAMCYLTVHVRNIQPCVNWVSTWGTHSAGYLGVHVRNIQPWATWVSTWGISSPELPGCPRG
jgi:hypothetical protein